MKFLSFIAFTLFFSLTVYSQVELQEFKAISSSAGITLTWKAALEKNIRSFDIERSTDGNDFVIIDNKKADGSSIYTFIDKDVFKEGENTAVQKGKYFYRLKVNFADGASDRSDAISVIHQVSSIRKSWGMLKEMFK